MVIVFLFLPRSLSDVFQCAFMFLLPCFSPALLILGVQIYIQVSRFSKFFLTSYENFLYHAEFQ
jgi:hypothetical protein